MNGQRERDKKLLLMKKIWAAMLGAVGVYIVITLVVVGRSGPLAQVDGQGAWLVEVAMLAVAAVSAAAALVLSGRQLSPDQIRRTFQPRAGRPAPASAHTYYFQVCLIRWAMIESIAVYGLVLSFLMGASVSVAVLYLATAALMVKFQPRAEELDIVERTVSRMGETS